MFIKVRVKRKNIQGFLNIIKICSCFLLTEYSPYLLWFGILFFVLNSQDLLTAASASLTTKQLLVLFLQLFPLRNACLVTHVMTDLIYSRILNDLAVLF